MVGNDTVLLLVVAVLQAVPQGSLFPLTLLALETMEVTVTCYLLTPYALLLWMMMMA